MTDYDLHLIARPRCVFAHPEAGGPFGSTGWYCEQGCHKFEPRGYCHGVPDQAAAKAG